MKKEITLFSERIDAITNAAIESDNKYDLPCLNYVVEVAVFNAESALGYGYDLEGEVDAWTHGCVEDPRLGHWDEQIRATCEMAFSYEQHIALALALHRAQWLLERVRKFGPKRY